MRHAPRRRFSLRHKDPGQQLLEAIHIHGLNKMVVEYRLAGGRAGLSLAPSSLGDDHRIVEERLLAKRATDFIAVHARHTDVEEDRVGPVFLRCLNGELALMNQPIVVADRLQHPAYGLRDIEIVVHDQNFQRPSSATRPVKKAPRRQATPEQPPPTATAGGKYCLAGSGAFGENYAAMHLDQLFHKREADSESSM